VSTRPSPPRCAAAATVFIDYARRYLGRGSPRRSSRNDRDELNILGPSDHAVVAHVALVSGAAGAVRSAAASHYEGQDALETGGISRPSPGRDRPSSGAGARGQWGGHRSA
jgi:hypothetical protein